MFIRYSKEEFQSLIDSETPFILMVYYMYQGKKIKGSKKFHDSLSIYPSFVSKYDELKSNKLPNELIEFHKNVPELKIMESYHHEVYDIMIDMGYDYNLLWREYDQLFQPLMLAFKGKNNVETSYSKCYCVETITELALFTNPELFKPTGISES